MEGMDRLMQVLDFYKGKKVFITGHTGFKGSWLSLWLSLLGAKVSGYSDSVPTQPAMYDKTSISNYMHADLRGDIADYPALHAAMRQIAPDIVIHLAAQPIVLTSYEAPLETFRTNMMGTACVLECIRQTSSVRCALVITTDKCYRNKEWVWGYREIDELGGNDPYSSSKACAELITHSYIQSFFSKGELSVATARAGNVIGGGDWAAYRLIPDIVRAAQAEKTLLLRHPGHVRPWQHVMEPLYGYLLLCQKLYEGGAAFTGAWNFGPDPSQNATVRHVAQALCTALGGETSYAAEEEAPRHEAALLSLDCSKAKRLLGWQPYLSLEQALRMTEEWYQKDRTGEDMLRVTQNQLLGYMRQIQQEQGV